MVEERKALTAVSLKSEERGRLSIGGGLKPAQRKSVNKQNVLLESIDHAK